MQINQTGKFKKKVGRPSNYVPNKSFILKNNLNRFLRKEFENLINDNEKASRVDFLATTYFKIVKKTLYYFIENWCTMNLFKEKNIFKLIGGYVEAASSFHFAQKIKMIARFFKELLSFEWSTSPMKSAIHLLKYYSRCCIEVGWASWISN